MKRAAIAIDVDRDRWQDRHREGEICREMSNESIRREVASRWMRLSKSFGLRGRRAAWILSWRERNKLEGSPSLAFSYREEFDWFDEREVIDKEWRGVLSATSSDAKGVSLSRSQLLTVLLNVKDQCVEKMSLQRDGTPQAHFSASTSTSSTNSDYSIIFLYNLSTSRLLISTPYHRKTQG